MPIFEIFHTELSKYPRGGLDHTYKTSFNFRHIGFKIWATVIVPVYIEFTVPELKHATKNYVISRHKLNIDEDLYISTEQVVYGDDLYISLNKP